MGGCVRNHGYKTGQDGMSRRASVIFPIHLIAHTSIRLYISHILHQTTEIKKELSHTFRRRLLARLRYEKLASKRETTALFKPAMRVGSSTPVAVGCQTSVHPLADETGGGLRGGQCHATKAHYTSQVMKAIQPALCTDFRLSHEPETSLTGDEMSHRQGQRSTPAGTDVSFTQREGMTGTKRAVHL